MNIIFNKDGKKDINPRVFLVARETDCHWSHLAQSASFLSLACCLSVSETRLSACSSSHYSFFYLFSLLSWFFQDSSLSEMNHMSIKHESSRTLTTSRGPLLLPAAGGLEGRWDEQTA